MDSAGHLFVLIPLNKDVSLCLVGGAWAEGRGASEGWRPATGEAGAVVQGPGNPGQLLSPGSEMSSSASAGVPAGVRAGAGMVWREGRVV